MPHRPPALQRHAAAALLAVALLAACLTTATPAAAAWGRPSGLTAQSTATTSVRLAWKAVSRAPAYRVKFDDNAAMTSPAYLVTTTPSAEVTGLKPGRPYWFKVRVVSAKDKALGAYGSPLKASTRKSGDFALLSPTRLAASDLTDSGLALSWAARSGAAGYRVRWTTSADLADAAYQRVTTTGVTLADLEPGRTYRVSVRAITADGANLSQYSPAISVRTTGTPAYPAPGAPAAVSRTSTSLALAWKAVTGAPGYRVKYTSGDWLDARYLVTTNPVASLSGLVAGTAYKVKVRVLDTDGSLVSGYSPALATSTEVTAKALRVASYNVRCANCSLTPDSSNEQPWSVRRALVVRTITGADPDVVSLQEAMQSQVLDASGEKTGVSQYEDIVGLLGSPWKVTSPYRYNCVRSRSLDACVTKDRAASRGTRIIYRTDRLALVSHGSKRLSSASNDDYERYVTWAVFRQVSTGRQFFFADTHLEHTDDTGTALTYYTLRRTQAGEVLATIRAHNPGNLPVVLAGDLDSTKWTTPGNAPYEVLTDAGLVDPLGNAPGSTKPVGATVEKRVNTSYNSYNAWERTARRSSNVNGSYTDYILTTPMRVSVWETVVDVSSAGKFRGVIASDHNLIRATLYLP